METTPQDAWFFTRQGERLGPVPLSDLRIKAIEGDLDPRYDLVWTQGMAEWKPAGEVDGIFEKRSSVQVRDSHDLSTDIGMMAEFGSAEQMMSQRTDWPGARRRSFLFMTMVFPLLWNFGFIHASPYILELAGPRILQAFTAGAGLLPAILIIYFLLQRLANVGMTRWWFFGSFVPILNFWVSYRMFACPAGYASHKKLDGIGVVLAVVYWLLAAAFLLMLVAVVAMLLGAIDQPELRKQLIEAIQSATRGSTKL